MRLLKLNFFILFVTMSGLAQAEEKPASGPAPTITKQQKEFIDKRSRLNSVTNRIGEGRKQFADAVRKKNAATTQDEIQRWIRAMNNIHQQLNADIETYNQLRNDLKLRYPNEGELLERQYKTEAKKSIEELEGVAGLDEKLTRTKKLIDKKYEPFLIEEEKRNQVAPEAVQTSAKEEPKRLRLEK